MDRRGPLHKKQVLGNGLSRFAWRSRLGLGVLVQPHNTRAMRMDGWKWPCGCACGCWVGVVHRLGTATEVPFCSRFHVCSSPVLPETDSSRRGYSPLADDPATAVISTALSKISNVQLWLSGCMGLDVLSESVSAPIVHVFAFPND